MVCMPSNGLSSCMCQELEATEQYVCPHKAESLMGFLSTGAGLYAALGDGEFLGFYFHLDGCDLYIILYVCQKGGSVDPPPPPPPCIRPWSFPNWSWI
jgi:hypothetical protein